MIFIYRNIILNMILVHSFICDIFPTLNCHYKCIEFNELSRSRQQIIIIIMSEFKVGGTYICTTAHYMTYKIFDSNTICYRLTLGYNAAKKSSKIKPDQRNHITPK